MRSVAPCAPPAQPSAVQHAAELPPNKESACCLAWPSAPCDEHGPPDTSAAAHAFAWVAPGGGVLCGSFCLRSLCGNDLHPCLLLEILTAGRRSSRASAGGFCALRPRRGGTRGAQLKGRGASIILGGGDPWRPEICLKYVLLRGLAPNSGFPIAIAQINQLLRVNVKSLWYLKARVARVRRVAQAPFCNCCRGRWIIIKRARFGL